MANKILQSLLAYPRLILVMLSLFAVAAVSQLDNFRFDASSETLVVEGDKRLNVYLEMNELFSGDEFLALTFAPRNQEHLLSPSSLKLLAELQRDLEALAGVASVFSILDAPLISSPPIPLEELSGQFKTLRSSDVDLLLAERELTTSPLYSNYLIARDASTSILRVSLAQANVLEEIGSAGIVNLSPDAQTVARRIAYVEGRTATIDQVRLLRSRYADRAEIVISGVPMIASDMISYVMSDLKTFGVVVFLLIVGFLFFFFRRWRWVFLPVTISALSILMTVGVLGFMDKPVTVVSSNFISLLAIICISFSIHLIVRYRELLANQVRLIPEKERRDSLSNTLNLIDHESLILQTMKSKFAPCLYTALTTILAFGSMLGSRIVPVEDFGWMMCLGITIAFIVTYLAFPTILLLLGVVTPSTTVGRKLRFTQILSNLSRKHPYTVVVFSIILFVFSAYGVSLVTFDNRFVDYFDTDTDVHAGMSYIDQHLGGTIPFDVYLRFEPFASVMDEEDDFYTEEDPYPDRYWYTPAKLRKLAGLHKFIEQLPNVGKVVSLSTLGDVAESLNENVPLTAVEMSFVMGELPSTVREQLVAPYASPSAGILRINARIMESGPFFSRDAMIARVEKYAVETLGMDSNDVEVTGMMVLFNDMLKQLADSQRQTIYYVLIATFVMFSLLLRSILLALIALIPNVIAATAVIATMGYSGIPLDMMTITIAAISIGIGVDDAIHYLHRYKRELIKDGNVIEAVRRAHLTIGRAMYFTSLTVIGGFSVLAFSSFVPTVYFGLLTALAMFLALLANLTILPSLLVAVYRRTHPPVQNAVSQPDPKL